MTNKIFEDYLKIIADAQNIVNQLANTFADQDFVAEETTDETPDETTDEMKTVKALINDLNFDLIGEVIEFDSLQKVDSKTTALGEEVALWHGTVDDEVYAYVIYANAWGAKQVCADGAYPMDIDEARTYQFDDGDRFCMIDDGYSLIDICDNQDNLFHNLTYQRLVALKNKYGTGIRVNQLSDNKEWIEWEDYKGNKYVSIFASDDVEDKETLMI